MNLHGGGVRGEGRRRRKEKEKEEQKEEEREEVAQADSHTHTVGTGLVWEQCNPCQLSSVPLPPDSYSPALLSSHLHHTQAPSATWGHAFEQQGLEEPNAEAGRRKLPTAAALLGSWMEPAPPEQQGSKQPQGLPAAGQAQLSTPKALSDGSLLCSHRAAAGMPRPGTGGLMPLHLTLSAVRDI